MKIYIIEPYNNKEIYSYLNGKYEIVTFNNIQDATVIIVNKVNNIRKGLDIIDCALSIGQEVICFKNKFGREYYVANYLIQSGAIYV